MSEPSSSLSLHTAVHQRFRQVFGEPNSTLGKDDHWSLKPSPTGIAINILVNGGVDKPAVWVFDPHDHKDGVMRTSIAQEAEVDQIIKQIQERLKRATERDQPGHA